MKKHVIKFATATGLISHPSVKCLISPTSYKNAHGDNVPYHGVYETTHHTLISFLTGINRPVTHSAQMGVSVTKFGNCRDAVVVYIAETKQMVYVDGQNLATFLTNSLLPIRFKLIHVADVREALEYMVGLNEAQVNWSLKQFVSSYSSLVPAYEKIQEYAKKYPALTLKTVIAIVCGSTVEVAAKIAKTGKVTITNQNAVEKKLSAINNLFFTVNLKGARATEGMLDYIDFIGISKYYAEQKQFIANIKKAKEQQPDLKGWTNQKDAYMFFLKNRPIVD